MKSTFFIILFFHCISLSFSQQVASFSDPTLGNTQIHNGTANVTYTLHEIFIGEIALPINLEYVGSRGIKVNQIASRVGLGWDLSAGGSVSRVIVGYPDDGNKGKEYKEGILFNNNLSEIEKMDTYSVTNKELEAVVKKDYEPDIFTIDLWKFSARFIFNKNKSVICIDNPNLKISFQQNSNGEIILFKVIDEDGLTYLFDKFVKVTEKTNFEYPKTGINGPEFVERSFYSTWKLSRVSDIWSNYVEFKYNEEVTSFSTNKVEKAEIIKEEGGISYPTIVGYDFIGSTDVIQNEKVLSEIISSSGERIAFTSDVSNRRDLSGGKALRSISVNEAINFDFITSYSNSSSKDYRLKLDEIRKNKGFYLGFEYDSKKLPERLSAEQDFWGYYNDNNSETLIPEVYIDESAEKKKSFVNYGYSSFNSSTYVKLLGADRRSNMNTEAGILKKVTDAKGGEKSFQYELNEFLDAGKLIKGNGLRISKILETDGSNTYETNFNYQTFIGGLKYGPSSGVVKSLPEYSYITPWRGIKYVKNSKLYEEYSNKKFRVTIPGGYTNEGSANWDNQEKFDITTVRFAFPVNSVMDDYAVFYSRIEEYGDLIEGKKVYNFDVPKYYQSVNDTKHRLNPDGFFVENDPIHEVVNADFGNAPFIPSSISRRYLYSLPVSTQYINDKNTKVYEKQYSYVYRSFGANRTIKGLKYSPLEQNSPTMYVFDLAIPYITLYHLFSKYNIMDDIQPLISSEKVTEVLSNGAVSNERILEYNSYNAIKKETWYSSEGDLFEKYYKYAGDFANNFPNPDDPAILQKLNILNLKNKPVEEVMFKNGIVVSGKIYKYGNFDGVIGLLEEKELNLKDVSKPYSFASLSIQGLSIDDRYVTTKFYDKYDSKGNLLQERRPNGIINSYVYGYNDNYLICELKNADYTKIPTSVIQQMKSETDEVVLRNLGKDLRNLFPEAQISVSTYMPFVGRTSVTDQKGYTTFYEYDSMNRLKAIRNDKKELIEEYQYNFKKK